MSRIVRFVAFASVLFHMVAGCCHHAHGDAPHEFANLPHVHPVSPCQHDHSPCQHDHDHSNGGHHHGDETPAPAPAPQPKNDGGHNGCDETTCIFVVPVVRGSTNVAAGRELETTVASVASIASPLEFATQRLRDQFAGESLPPPAPLPILHQAFLF